MAELNIRFTVDGTAFAFGNVELKNNMLDKVVQLSAFSTNTISSYFWQVLDCPQSSQVVLSDTRSANPTFTPDLDGTYLIRLTVNGGISGEQSVTAYIGYYTHFMETRIPAAGETTQKGLRGWATDVGSALRKVVNASGRGNVWLCKNDSGAVLLPGEAVLLTGMEEEEIKPGVVKATTQLYNSAITEMANVGISLGDPIYRKSVADQDEVLVAFGPGVVTGLTISGSVPDSFPASLTLGSEAGELEYGNSPVVAHALNSEVAIFTPVQSSTQGTTQTEERILVITEDYELSYTEMQNNSRILMDASYSEMLGKTLSLYLPEIPESELPIVRIIAKNGNVNVFDTENNIVRQLEDKESVELLYYNYEWILIGGAMPSVDLAENTLDMFNEFSNKLTEMNLRLIAEVRRLAYIQSEDCGIAAELESIDTIEELIALDSSD